MDDFAGAIGVLLGYIAGAVVVPWMRGEFRPRAVIHDTRDTREERHAEALERARQQHLDDLREQLRIERERTAPDMLALARTLVTGTPEQPRAESFVVAEPEMRARLAGTEEAVSRGMADLRSAYEAAGIAVPSDEELREDVEAIMRGEPPKLRQ